MESKYTEAKRIVSRVDTLEEHKQKLTAWLGGANTQYGTHKVVELCGMRETLKSVAKGKLAEVEKELDDLRANV